MWQTSTTGTPPTAESINNMLDHVLLNAIQQNVSDIHFEPNPNDLTVRFRVDGLMQLFKTFPKETQQAMLSRIKILSELDIAEQRLPQDGHLKFSALSNIYHFRVSTLPTSNGETVVLRMLNKEDNIVSLTSLGLDPKQFEDVKKLISNPYGIILSTGPTGSGKTTLLYSILHEINGPQKNILTLEDPIEMQISNTQQVQINEGIDLTFARSMRAVVRQDPDIIMLGEIRDPDTAQMAMQAALIGILIFSTFHTFDIPALTTRFLELGISHSITAQAVKGVISTRLVRKLCEACKTAYSPTSEEVQQFHLDGKDTGKMAQAKGCDKCMHTGYTGRIGIFEVVVFDKDIQQSIISNDTATMYHVLEQKQIKTLKDSAIDKVIEGITTIDEMKRVLGVL